MLGEKIFVWHCCKVFENRMDIYFVTICDNAFLKFILANNVYGAFIHGVILYIFKH
jgi:hypothetical protein